MTSRRVGFGDVRLVLLVHVVVLMILSHCCIAWIGSIITELGFVSVAKDVVVNDLPNHKETSISRFDCFNPGVRINPNRGVHCETGVGGQWATASRCACPTPYFFSRQVFHIAIWFSYAQLMHRTFNDGWRLSGVDEPKFNSAR
jgi:hypothetical protein